jgi:glycosyltransferase involved in cell wall biosynthesis
MGPAVLARALDGTGVPYAVKIHGSALEYTVKPYPRVLPYAREGLAGASGIMAGSRHTAESLWAAMDDPGLPDRTRLGPPGVDVAEFRPEEPAEARRRLRDYVAAAGGATGGAAPGAAHAFARDPGEAGRALAGVDADRDRLVVFVGKFIASKGLELLLAAWPLVLREHPDARLLVVGFGGWRGGLEELAEALARGDVEAARAIRAEDGRELPQLAAFLDSLDGAEREAYVGAAAGLRERVSWTGRLDHHELAELLPAAEALVAPSTFPEAFGMVAAEGAACGALPVVARHSGLAEVAAALSERVPEEARAWLSFELGPEAVRDLAGCLTGWMSAGQEVRAATREAIVAVTRERWSWDGVARTVLAAAQGDLDALPRP